MPSKLLAHVLDALQVALWISLPLLLAVWLAGLLSAAFASLTRLGDATTSTVPRQLALALALWASVAWAGQSLLELTERLWAQLVQVGGP